MVEERADWQEYEFACEADTMHAYEWCKKNLPWEDVYIVHDQPKLRFRNRSVWQKFVEGYNPFTDEEPKKRAGFTFVCDLPDWYDKRTSHLTIYQNKWILVDEAIGSPYMFDHDEKKWRPLTFKEIR